MSASITASELFDTLHEKLGLKWIAGRAGADRNIRLNASRKTSASLVGHLSFMHPNLVQVIDTTELDYLKGLSASSRQEALRRLFTPATSAVVIAGGHPTSRSMKERAETSGTPLWKSNLPGQEVVNDLQYYLTNLLAERVTVHGVFMDVMGIGVLITGASGVGKSELALELLTRGHRLIADDAPEFARIAPDILQGTCPAPLHDFLEVRGLGLLNVRAMFGDSAMKESKYLRLVIRLEPLGTGNLRKLDRLQGSRRTCKLLEIDVPEITLPVAPGRNLAVLVEVAVRNHILNLKGYDASSDFIAQQQRLIGRDEA